MPKRPKNPLIRKITRNGGYSLGITLPMAVIREFRWKERQKVQLKIKKRKKEIVIADWKK